MDNVAIFRRAIAVCVLAASFAVFAIDTTIDDDFWCTKNYVNPAPSVEVGVVQGKFDSGVFDRVESSVMSFFSSVRRGVMLLMR